MKRNQILPMRGLSTLAITTGNPLPNGQEGSPYSVTLSATGGQGNYQWTLLQDYGGSGLTLAANGVFSGTLAAAGLLQWVVQVSDGVESVQNMFYAQVASATALQITTSSPLPSGTVGAPYSTTISAIGGTPPYQWSLNSVPAPFSWMGIGLTTGVISGTPASATSGSVNVALVDSLGASTQKPFSLTVNAALGQGVIGANLSAGGGGTLVFEGLPLFKNQVRASFGFTNPAGGEGTQVALSSAGWPTQDFTCVLFGGSLTPAWVTAGPFYCGFMTTTGTESISGNSSGSISNIVRGAIGTYTTFQCTLTGGGGFKITGTSGTTSNVFAYRYEDRAMAPAAGTSGAIDNPAQTGTYNAATSPYTSEAVTYYSQYNSIRAMNPQATVSNSFQGSSTTRRTATNTQASQAIGWQKTTIYGIGQVVSTTTAAGGTTFLSDTSKSWTSNQFVGAYVYFPTMSGTNVGQITGNGTTTLAFTAVSSSVLNGMKYIICLQAGATSATLLNAWPGPSGNCILTFPDAAFDGVACAVTYGSTTVTLVTALPTNCTQGYCIYGVEGYPIEWWMGFANACNVALWICGPVYQDGIYGGPGSWWTSVLNYAKTNFPNLKLILEHGNEPWNNAQLPYRCFDYLQAQSGLSFGDYYGQCLHQLATIGRTVYGSAYGTQVQQVATWQGGGNGLSLFATAFPYIQSTYSIAPSADVQLIAHAPYLTPTIGNSDSIATIQSEIAGVITSTSLSQLNENWAVTGCHYGMPVGAYELGVQWDNMNQSAVNGWAAWQDTGIESVLETYLTNLLSTGFSGNLMWFNPGVSGLNTDTPADCNISNNYATFVSSGCAVLTALQQFMNGFSGYTRNLVSSHGSVVSGANFADNATGGYAAQLAQAGSGGTYVQLAPYFGSNGYLPYVVYCTLPGTYSLVINTSNSSGSTTSPVVVNGTTVASALSLPGGNAASVSVTLVAGPNEILLGGGPSTVNSANQGCTINSLTFN